MPTYRRLRHPGATWFFTVNLAERGATALTDRIDLLREAYRLTAAEQPIRCGAMVILPDHIHAVWTLPPGDADVSRRWQKIKGRFTHASGLTGARLRGRLWQRRFCEHLLRDPDEERRAIAYCLNDPVRHGLVGDPADWPFSTIHRDLRAHPAGSPALRTAA